MLPQMQGFFAFALPTVLPQFSGGLYDPMTGD